MKSVVWTIFRQSSGILLSFLALSMIARNIGPSLQGQYSLLVILPQTLFSLFSFGTISALVYFYNVESKEYRQSVITHLTVFNLFLVLAYVTLPLYKNKFFEGIPESLIVTSLLLFPVIFLNFFLQGVQQAKQKWFFLSSDLL